MPGGGEIGAGNVHGFFDAPLTRRVVAGATHLAVALVSLWLLASALAVMRAGIAPVAHSAVLDHLTGSVVSSLFVGVGAALVVLSGSPVAASAIVLQEAGALGDVSAWAMIVGSRIGASLVVLALALFYVRRRGSGPERRHRALVMGASTVLTTLIAYVPALLLGLPLLANGAGYLPEPSIPVVAIDFLALVTQPIVEPVLAVVSGAALFPVGAVMVLGALRLLDLAVPDAPAEERVGAVPEDSTSHPTGAFVAGCVAGLVVMSVSVAAMLVMPLVLAGRMRMSSYVAYVMGVNVLTLGDTLMTAVLVASSGGIQLVVLLIVLLIPITGLLMVGPVWRGYVRALRRMGQMRRGRRNEASHARARHRRSSI